MPSSGLTDDRRNFHCVTVASVDLIPPVLRDILTSYIQPVNLYNQIKLKNLNLRKEQQAICFIPPASGVPDYNKFDVTCYTHSYGIYVIYPVQRKVGETRKGQKPRILR